MFTPLRPRTRIVLRVPGRLASIPAHGARLGATDRDRKVIEGRSAITRSETTRNAIVRSVTVTSPLGATGIGSD